MNQRSREAETAGLWACMLWETISRASAPPARGEVSALRPSGCSLLLRARCCCCEGRVDAARSAGGEWRESPRARSRLVEGHE